MIHQLRLYLAEILLFKAVALTPKESKQRRAMARAVKLYIDSVGFE